MPSYLKNITKYASIGAFSGTLVGGCVGTIVYEGSEAFSSSPDENNQYHPSDFGGIKAGIIGIFAGGFFVIGGVIGALYGARQPYTFNVSYNVKLLPAPQVVIDNAHSQPAPLSSPGRLSLYGGSTSSQTNQKTATHQSTPTASML